MEKLIFGLHAMIQRLEGSGTEIDLHMAQKMRSLLAELLSTKEGKDALRI